MIDEPTRTDTSFTSLVEQARLLRAGEATSRDLVEQSLERIERLDPRINAFRRVLADSARADADAAQARLAAGERAPLLGVPVAVKDNVDMAGEPTTHGTGAADGRAAGDAEVVRRLRAAGAVIVGKTNLPELAMWGHFTASETHGVTRNPWNTERSPGGSSGGSAAAVAAGMVAAAVGSDGGASIRVPAALCGLFGMKPQRGLVPLAPDDGHWHGLTHFGPIARTAEDAGLLLDAIADGGGFAEAATREPAPLRIGLALKPTMPQVRLSKPWRAGVERTVQLLRELGHEVVEVKPSYGVLLPLAVPRYAAGVADDAARLEHPDRLEKRSRRMAALGRRLHGRPLRRAIEREQAYAQRVNRVFERVDVLLTPTVAKSAGTADASAGHGAFRTFNDMAPYVAYTTVWNYTGQPAAAVPAGFDDDGMPLSAQLVTRPGDNETLLSLAAQIERAGEWGEHRPALA
ncbi:MAG: amidase [Thermoleophilaceae bacterium]|nr:amidase [Thermoleophilaceae bacterium]